MTTRTRAVILDFDDTLADSRRHRAPVMADVLSNLGAHPVSADDVRRMWGVPFRTLVSTLAPSVDYEVFTASYTRSLSGADPVFFSGSAEFLRLLHDCGVIVIILTTGGRELIVRELELAGLAGCVTAVFGTDETAFQKPDPRALDEVLEVLRQLRIDPAETVYIGDSLNDLQVARGRAIAFLGVTSGTASPADFLEHGVPDEHIFSTIATVSPVVERMVDADRHRLSSIATELDDEQLLDYYEVALGYAATWFTYHANQRLQGFNFFLLIETAYVIAAVTVVNNPENRHLVPWIAVLGFLTVVPFFLMEIRNTELVNNGRAALDALEEGLAETPWHRRTAALAARRRQRTRQARNVEREAAGQFVAERPDDAIILPRQRDQGRLDLAGAMAIIPARKEHDLRWTRIDRSLGMAKNPKVSLIGKGHFDAVPTEVLKGRRRWRSMRYLASHERILRFILLSIAAAWIVVLAWSL